jgi:hypothetical protein
MTRYWLGVVCREHAHRGVELGIAQIGHGKRGGLVRMQEGDWLLYYSPTVSLGRKEPLQEFTAIGKVADDVIGQADEGEFRPWRRRVDYDLETVDVSIRPLIQSLDLTSKPNWGYQLRRGLIELSKHDFDEIRAAMKADL